MLAVHRTSVGLPLAVSIGIPLDFRWLCQLEWSFPGVGLLLVHRNSVGKVRWTEKSDQKFPDKQRKMSGKWLALQSKKNADLDTLSPTESAWSPLGKAVAG